MRVSVLMALGLIGSAFAAAAVGSQPAPAPAEAAAPANIIDSKAQREVVAKLSDALRNDYVFPDVGAKAADSIDAALAAGAYDGLSDAGAFAARLSSDVAAVAHDKHLSVRAQGGPPRGPAPGPAGAVVMTKRRIS